MLAVLAIATGLLGVVVGILMTILSQSRRSKRTTDGLSQDVRNKKYDTFCDDDRRRQRLPELIVLVRHGESEGNADDSLYRNKPDHIINLTPLGVEQAALAGERLEREVFGAYEQETKAAIRRVHLTVSPFERTLQTAAALRIAVDGRIVRTDIEPRIREQEFGNVQTSQFRQLRAEQRRIGRF
jgi:Histidine phosphatase superfamily (branch 1)